MKTFACKICGMGLRCSPGFWLERRRTGNRRSPTIAADGSQGKSIQRCMPANGHRLGFLIIESERSDGLSTRKLLLESAKHNVVTAYSGKEGVEMYKRRQSRSNQACCFLSGDAVSFSRGFLLKTL